MNAASALEATIINRLCEKVTKEVSPGGIIRAPNRR
jgi:hypothetical protein